MNIPCKQKWAYRLAAMALTGALLAGGVLLTLGPAGMTSADGKDPPVEWVGQTNAAESSAQYSAAEALCTSLTDATGGEIGFTLHPGGDIVPEGDEYQAVEDGVLDFAISSSHLGAGPEEDLFRFRMNGKTPEEKLDWYKNGDGSALMQQWLDNEFADLAFVPASGVMGAGEVFLHSDVRIESLMDLEELKVRVAGDGGIIFSRLGASATYLPAGEIENAMDAGVIDAFELSDACFDWQMGCQDWAEYVYVSSCRWAHNFAPLLVGKSLWQGLDQSTRDALADAGSQTTLAECLDLVAQDGACLQQFEDYPGCEVQDLPESVEQGFRREAYLYYRDQADTHGALYDEVHRSLLRFGLPTGAWIGQCSCASSALAEELCDAMTSASGGEATFMLVPEWSVCPTLLEGQAVEDGILDFAVSSTNGLEYDLPAMKVFTAYMGGMSYQEKLYWYTDQDGTSLLEQGLEASFDNVSFIPDAGIMGPGEVFLHSRIPLDSPDDWQGLDMRAAGDIGMVHGEMGADVQFLLHPNEISLALEDGRISAFEYGGACLNWTVGCQDWAQYIYESDCGTAHDFAPLLVQKSLWESLDASTRDAITDVAQQKTTEFAGILADAEEDCMQQFRDHPACDVYNLAPEVKTAFLQHVRQYYANEVVHHGAFYQEVLDALEFEGPQGLFTRVSGGVSWSGGTGTPSVGDEVLVGTEIETDATGSADLSMIVGEGECTLSLNPDSRIKVSDDPADELGTIEFFQGEILAKVRDLPPEGFEIQTPQAIAGSRGTEWIVSGDADEITITVLEGSVEVSTPDGSETSSVDEAHELVATSAGLGTPSPTSYSDIALDLSPGWNMVSVPMEHPFSMSTDVLLGDLDGVYTWDPVSGTYITPSVICPEKGYWVEASNACTVALTGTAVTDLEDGCTEGWNIIGSVHGGTVAVEDLDQCFAGPIQTDSVYRWNCQSQAYQEAVQIEPCESYWLAKAPDFSSYPPPPPESPIVGDTTQDGVTNIVDAMFIAQYTVGLRGLDERQMSCSDTTGDGTVNIVDAMHIAQYTVDPSGVGGVLFKPLWEFENDGHAWDPLGQNAG